MSIWRIFLREAVHRPGSVLSGIMAVAIAVGAAVASHTVLDVHDRHTEALLAEVEAETEEAMASLREEMREATLKLKFNLVILPEGQDLREWHEKDYASQYMPEEYVTRLATSRVVTVRHFLPSLQQRIVWPETKRTIILIGSRGEVPNLHKNPLKPLVQPVPKGTIVLGHELHRSLSLQEGDSVRLLGRDFTVHRCHEARGSKDDITAWINLAEAQELLSKEGLINAILALECMCVGVEGLPRVRAEIARVLPGTRVLESGTKALARMEARVRVGRESQMAVEREREGRQRLRRELSRASGLLLPMILITAAAWIAFLGFMNVRDRAAEIGMLRAMGFRSAQILALFLAKPLAISIPGSIMGLILGHVGGVVFSSSVESRIGGELYVVPSPAILLTAIALGATIAVLAGWLPALLASREDPADILRKE